MRAERAECSEARIAHHGMASGYAERIRLMQRLIGAEGTAVRPA
jgi:hypothetical protein